MIHPYEILQKLVTLQHPNVYNTNGQISEKLKYFNAFAHEHDIQCILDCYNGLTRNKYQNIYLNPQKIIINTPLTIISAHYDTVNVNADNVLDNQGSVANLLALAVKLKENQTQGNFLLALLDSEETANMNTTGSAQLMHWIEQHGYQVAQILNLELTCRGTKFVCDCPNPYNFKVMRMPFNDAVVFRQHGKKAYCLCTLDQKEYDGEKPNYWSYCHSNLDRMELANKEDMINVVDMVYSLLTR
jgi:hypothetical protein